jgi:hypothetical protein
MGMSDGDVEAGRFDRPGMMAEHSMHMGKGHHVPGIGHERKDSKHEIKQTHPAPHAAASGRMPSHGAMTMASEGSAEGRHHIIPSEPMREGKRYGRNFRLLASDVSASDNLAVDGMSPERPWAPYDRLRATRRTAFSKGRPVREIRLTLDGDMERYVWMLNNKVLSETDAIRIRQGEVVRFIMINRTMMHHPMHLHGHFFRVVNKQGDHAPLKHTVDVAPMSTTVIEFDANEFGDWFFHCHLLYHMKAGMARVIHYDGFVLDPQLEKIRPELYKESWYFRGRANALSNMTDGFVMASSTRNIFTAEWEVGWQDVDGTEWEGIFTYDRYFNRFFTLFVGVDLEGVNSEHDERRGVFGLRYLLPLNLETRAWIDTDGGARFNLGKHFELTPRLELFGEVQYDTHEKWEGKVGLSYTIGKSVSVLGKWHSDYGFGGGLQIRF